MNRKTNQTTHVAQLSLLVLRCTDLKASVAFYRALGFDFQEEQHGNGPKHFASENNDFVFELYPTDQPSDIKSRLGFRVTSLEETIINLRALGIEATPQNSAWGIRAIVRDPDGRTVEINESS